MIPADRASSRPHPAALAKLLLALVLLAAAPGCAKLQRDTAELPGAAQVWNKFIKSREMRKIEDSSFSCSASLNYASPQAKNRVVIHFFGRPGLPLRLDLTAGIGAVFALCREDEDGFVAYLPGEKRAYLHTDSARGMKTFGFSTPYSLSQLAFLLNGGWGRLVPRSYQSVKEVAGKGYEYLLKDAEGESTLLVDHAARPLEYRGPGEPPWRVSFSGYDEEDPSRPPARIVMKKGAVSYTHLTLPTN